MNDLPNMAKNKLQTERKIRGWSRKYVANEIGVSEYTIGQWERGKHTPYPEHIQKLCDLFEKNAEALGLAGIPSEMIFEIRAEVKEEQDSITNSSLHEQQREEREEREDAAFAFNSSITGTTASSQVEKRRRLFFSIIGIVLALAVVFCFIMYMIHPFSPLQIKPGGAWISPVGPTVGDIIQFEAFAYPTHAGEPEIEYVNFTAFWPGVDPRMWIIACVARLPVRKDVFACDANLRLLGAQPGRIKISFDVYDRQGNVNFAPNGEHTVTYIPS
ncbi:MAG: helix-turn-helix transcriptional regulator [Ktedonobacteraceae bacterium]